MRVALGPAEGPAGDNKGDVDVDGDGADAGVDICDGFGCREEIEE